MTLAPGLALLPAVDSDAEAVARLRNLEDPDSPWNQSDVLWYWESDRLDGREFARWVVRGGDQLAGFAGWDHRPWEESGERWTSLRVDATSDDVRDALYEHLERSQALATHLTTTVRETLTDHLALLARRGYGPERVGRWWELDLVEARPRLEAMAAEARDRMAAGGVRMLTWDRAELEHAGLLEEASEVSSQSELDVPSSGPKEAAPLELFRAWLDAPGIHRDRWWVALDSEGVAGMSVLRYSADVWTDWTCTARRARGRGIARALKLETVLQAAELGVRAVRTENDGENAPILHLNQEFGYRPIPGLVQLLKKR